MVECGICFAEYQEGELELHRQLCVLLLVFRCTLCNVDFVNKEGLWNHLELHEIADESKELHYQEMKARHKLHQCVLCNDQRAYSESLYWNHIREVHDSLQSDSQNNDQSDSQNNDQQYCDVGDQTAASELNDLEIDPIKIENRTSDQDEEVSTKHDFGLKSSANSENLSPAENHVDGGRSRRSARIKYGNLDAINDSDSDGMSKKSISPKKSSRKSISSDTTCPQCNKEYATDVLLRRHIRIAHKPIKCSVCGIIKNGASLARYHKVYAHTDPKFECAKCQMKFHFKSRYDRHLKFCPHSRNIHRNHVREVHDVGEMFRSDSQNNDQEYCDVGDQTAASESNDLEIDSIKIENRSSDQDEEVSTNQEFSLKSSANSENQSPAVNHADGGNSRQSARVKYDNLDAVNDSDSDGTTEKSISPKRSSRKSILSDTTCPQCNKEYATDVLLRRHIRIAHTPIKCSVCGIIKNGSSLARQHKVYAHTEPKFECAKCQMKFHFKYRYDRHQKFCPHSKSIHRNHVREVHDVGEMFRSDSQNNDQEYCDVENQTAASELNDLEIDPIKIENRTSDQDEEVSTNQDFSLKSYANSENQSPAVNHADGGKSRRGARVKYDGLDAIMDSHSDDTKCPLCNKEYGTDTLLRKHIRVTHMPVKCGICGIIKNGTSLARYHKINVHTDPKYECAKCQKKYHFRNRYLQHTKICEVDGTTRKRTYIKLRSTDTKCSQCSKEYATAVQLHIHIRVCHRPIECSICKITLYGTSAAEFHKIHKHTEPKFECATCSKKFHFRTRYNQHLLVHPDPSSMKINQEIQKNDHEVRSYHCELNDLEKASIKIKNKASDQDEEVENKKDFSLKSSANSEKQSPAENHVDGGRRQRDTTCPHCFKYYATYTLMRIHINTAHKPIKCSICGITSSGTSIARNHKLYKHTDPKHECPKCQKKFHSRSYCIQHTEVCDGTTHKRTLKRTRSNTKCSQCNKEFPNDVLLNAHFRTSHKPIECSLCKITLYGTSAAENHKIFKHTEPQFECDKCSKKFHFRKRYNQHLRIHLGSDVLSTQIKQPPDENLVDEGKESGSLGNSDKNNEASSTECSHCGIKESSAVTLIRHILTHHQPIGCDLCGATSANLLEAQNHKETIHKESKTKCPYCATYGFGGRIFEKHVLKCELSKSLCEFCGKMFENTSALNYHKLNTCRAKAVLQNRANVSAEHGQKHTETISMESSHASQGKTSNESDSSTVIDKIVSPLSGLSDTKCYYCDEDFFAPGYLIHHLRTYHELSKCNICGITIYGISSRRFHKVICHTTPRFVCPTCGRTFYSKAKYDIHWRNCERKKYSCELCGRKFRQVKSVLRHNKLVHSDSITPDETMISSQNHPGQSSANIPTHVDGTALVENANVHEKVRSTGPSLTQEGNSSNKKEIQSLLDVRPSEQSVGSGNGDDVTDNHMHEKESPRQFQCSICDKYFSEFSVIRQHMLTNHTDGQFRCHICSKKLRRLDELEEHEIVCAERIFSCEYCTKKFKTEDGLKRHAQKIHTDNLPLGNTIVEGTTDSTEGQQSSAVKKSESSDTKCPYCEKSYATETLLSRHTNICHEPKACDICGLTFANISKAKYHKINIHLKHSTFECPYCPMKFRIEERFKQHLSTCKRKALSCDICGMKYSSTHHRFLAKHKETCHQGKKGSVKFETQKQAEQIGPKKESVTEETNSSSIAASSNLQGKF